MLYIHFLAVGLITSAIAAPATEKRTIPTVNLPNSQVVGSNLVGIDSFRGIPYAQPPVGNLRLKPPQPISSSLGTVLATGIPRACPQFTAQTNTSFLPANVATALLNSPLFQTATNAGEDCLTVNVQRPSTATSSSKLPVVFWIFGGGFESGSTQAYDASNLILTSMRQSKPVIYVSVNYRVGGFGFLPGSQVLADGSSNLGLLDQRLALQWVADNIGFFGGDPSKVTIWGESAGSISVYDQMALYGGDNTYKGKPLFRAAIMDSGSIVPADPVDCPKGQAIYNTVVTNAGCSSASDTLSCLRNVSYTTFLNAANSVPALFSYNSLALSYLPRPDGKVLPDSPDVSIAEGSYAKVPLIIGDQEDEGTIFAFPLSNITSTDEIVNYLHSLYYQSTSPDQIRTLVNTYPDDKGVSGSPFNTGSLNNLYPEYKRISAILGDVTFTLMRRVFLGFYGMNGVPSWSYLARYGSTVPIVGTYHGSDVPVAYGVAGIPTVSIQTYYLNFINNLDPNSNLAPSSTLLGSIVGTLPIASDLIPYWPQWNSADVTGASSGNGGTLLSFGATANTIDSDGFRESSFDALRELVDGGFVRI